MTRAYRTAPRPWTPEEDAALRAVYRRKGSGIRGSLMKTAQEINRTYDAVIYRAGVLGLRKPNAAVRRYTDADEAAIREFWADGEPSKQAVDVLAKKLDRTPSSLIDKAYRLGLTNRDVRGATLYPPQNEDWAERKCLHCGNMFMSWGVGNRRCKKCAESKAFRLGDDMSVAI